MTAQDGREKTTFNAGDSIWYTVVVRNSGPPVSVQFTWQGKYDDPDIGRTIFSNKNTVTVQTGSHAIYSPGQVPTDAAGPYVNKETVTVGGQTMVAESKFNVAGGEGCMFNAPDSVVKIGDMQLVGHVGWAFKTGPGMPGNTGRPRVPSRRTTGLRQVHELR